MVHTDEEAIKKMIEAGWQQKPFGYYRNNKNEVTDDKSFILLSKSVKLSEFLESEHGCSPTNVMEKPHEISSSSMGSTSTMGAHNDELTPCNALPLLGDFSSYPSLASLQSDKPSLLIGYDTEWDNDPVWRKILSWQFAVIHDDQLVEYIFFPGMSDKRLDVLSAIGCILDDLDYDSIDERKLIRYKYSRNLDTNGKPDIVTTDSLDEARSENNYIYKGNMFLTDQIVSEQPDLMITDKTTGILRYSKRYERDWGWFHQYIDLSGVSRIPVTLCCLKGDADLTSFEHDSTYEWLERTSTNIQGGRVMLKPVILTPKSRSSNHTKHRYLYPVRLSLADGMCHAPAGHKSLAALGKTIHVQKIDVPKAYKENMSSLLAENPVLYADYATQDAVVVLLYLSAIYGYNREIPVTITSAGARIGRTIIMNELGTNNKTFDPVYRGLHKVHHGLAKNPDGPGFTDNTSLEPISDSAKRVQQMASDSYHGGFNACTEVGYFPGITYDVDLENAYPTAMCLVPDIDWSDPIQSEVIRRKMHRQDFIAYGSKMNPLKPFVGYVRFKFPESVKYPCIPINDNGVPVYPRSSEGVGDGVYVAGPYIYLALMLGADIYCETGFFLNPLLKEDGSVSYALSSAVKQLVQDRTQAKKDHGKGSLEELIHKTIVNSFYGKVAQNVIEKHTWSAFKKCMEGIGCSVITNPVSATMITGIVQAELIAAGNELNNLGYKMLSVTTDGFITDAPIDVIQGLDLYGLADFMRTARLFLTDHKDPSLWSVKHIQDDLVNFTTRGNISLHDFDPQNPNDSKNPMNYEGKKYPGVCAHNGLKYHEKRDSYEDRLHLMTDIVSRNGRIKSSNKHFPSNKEMLLKNSDFIVTEETRNISQDFDLKRKPVRSSFHPDIVVIDGKGYEIAHFDTEPYETIEEFRMYRAKGKLCDCLRTMDDWRLFWLKVDAHACGTQVHVDSDWSILMSCIMGYRSGRWDIPMLSAQIPIKRKVKKNGDSEIRYIPFLSVKEKCDWINKHNTSKKKFTESDWKNCNRPERQVNMLPLSVIQSKLLELQADIPNIRDSLDPFGDHTTEVKTRELSAV